MRAADEEGRVPQRWYLVTVVPTAAEPTWGQLSTWMDDALARAAELPDARGIPSSTQDAGTDRGTS